jgi:hypothetical protein
MTTAVQLLENAIAEVMNGGNPVPEPFGDFGASTDAATAVDVMVKNYVNLQTWGGKLAEIARATGTVPCNILDNYHRAVKEYLRYGQQLFDQLAAQGVQGGQVVYDGAQPKRNPDGSIRVLSIPGPLRPMTFVRDETRCPGVTWLSGSTFGFGLGQVPPPGTWPKILTLASALGPYIWKTGLAVLTYLGLSKLLVVVEHFNATPGDVVKAYVECYDKQRADKISPDAASLTCQGITAERGLPMWAWLLIGGGALVGGFFLFRAVEPGARERRARIVAAEDEARRLRAEAKAGVRRARGGGRGGGGYAPPAYADEFEGARPRRCVCF